MSGSAETRKLTYDRKYILMSAIIDGLLFSWKKNADYGARLVSDLSNEQMTLQPAPQGQPASNHPAWVLSHLNVYVPVIASLIAGEEFEDPKGHQFGMQSKPESDPGVYAPKDELVTTYVSGHERVAELLSNCSDDLFDREMNLERWKPIMPTLGTALPYLMLLHENCHLGQLSAWRRIQGMPSV